MKYEIDLVSSKAWLVSEHQRWFYCKGSRYCFREFLDVFQKEVRCIYTTVYCVGNLDKSVFRKIVQSHYHGELLLLWDGVW